MNKIRKRVFKELNVSNYKAMSMLLEMPFYFTWFFALRFIANNPETMTNFENSPFLWISNFSLKDPYFLLPVISSLA